MTKKNQTQTAPAAEAKTKNAVFSKIINVVLIAAIIFGIFVSFTAFISKSGNGVPSFFGIRPFAIQTDSMLPTFAAGDMIIDKKVDPDTLVEGDVITFWTVIEGSRVLNTHRIVEINDYGTYRAFTTKGDNNTIEDGLTVHQSEVVGIYKFAIPKLGKAIDFLQTGTGFLIVIVIPVAIFFIYYLISFFKALFAYKAEKMRLQFEAENAARMGQPMAAAAGAYAAPVAPAAAYAAPAQPAAPVQPAAPAAPVEAAPVQAAPAEASVQSAAPAPAAPAEEPKA